MRVVIVYESLFGNTHEVAEAIQDGIRSAMPHAQVSCVRAAEATRDTALGADLLVVGGPTHAHGMASAVTRKMGLKAEERVPAKVPGHQAEQRAAGPGVREWFHGLPRAPMGSLGAAFDTRGEVRMAGGAAKGIARRLRHRRYELVSPPAGFIVDDVEGPLRPGELERARSWGAGLLR
ncbi:MAG TPA: flavodoxin [Streptosporangiaceae bacterium]